MNNSIISLEESRRLIELERKIERGLQTFVEVGEALMEIRDSRLYRIEHKTFEDYCRGKWNMSIRYADKIMLAAGTAENIRENTPTGVFPSKERQVRPLTKLEPEQQSAAWERAVEMADGEQPTAKQVESAVTEILNPEYLAPYNHRGLGTGQNEWHTPMRYIQAAREVMTGIDLDPASNALAQKTIQAANIFTKEDDGLSKSWTGRVWLNPPYSQPEIRLFCEKLVKEYESGKVSEAILLTHNYTDTSWFHIAESSAVLICFTKGRIKFVDELGNECSPTQGQAFFYYGRNGDKFREVFEHIGFVR